MSSITEARGPTSVPNYLPNDRSLGVLHPIRQRERLHMRTSLTLVSFITY
jgi:hypothetical protein